MTDSTPHSELIEKVRQALLRADNVTAEGEPEWYHVEREAIAALEDLVEQLEAAQRERGVVLALLRDVEIGLRAKYAAPEKIAAMISRTLGERYTGSNPTERPDAAEIMRDIRDEASVYDEPDPASERRPCPFCEGRGTLPADDVYVRESSPARNPDA